MLTPALWDVINCHSGVIIIHFCLSLILNQKNKPFFVYRKVLHSYLHSSCFSKGKETHKDRILFLLLIIMKHTMGNMCVRACVRACVCYLLVFLYFHQNPCNRLKWIAQTFCPSGKNDNLKKKKNAVKLKLKIARWRNLSLL